MSKLPDTIIINNSPAKPLGWFKVHGFMALVMLNVDKDKYNEYFYILPSSFSLFKIEELLSTRPDKKLIKYNSEDVKDPKYKNNCLFRINKKYVFKMEYDLKDKWIGFIMKNDNRIVYDELNIGDFKRLASGKYVLENIEKYNKKENKIKYKETYYKSDDIKQFFEDDDELHLIVKNLNHPIYFDLNGTMRFKKEKLTDKENVLKSNLNAAWMEFHENKILFTELLSLYIKTNSSISLFSDTFYSYFLKYPEGYHSVDEDHYEEEYEDEYEDCRILCSEEEIKNIILGTQKPYMHG